MKESPPITVSEETILNSFDLLWKMLPENIRGIIQASKDNINSLIVLHNRVKDLVRDNPSIVDQNLTFIRLSTRFLQEHKEEDKILLEKVKRLLTPIQ